MPEESQQVPETKLDFKGLVERMAAAPYKGTTALRRQKKNQIWTTLLYQPK